jgi:hypothetical protein
MNRKLAALVFCLALFGAPLVPSARADEGNQEMMVTIKNAPLEVPGSVLKPGKYDMRFAGLEHDVVEITTADGSKSIGFFEVLPVSRSHRSDHARLDLSKAAPGSVSRLTDFFYPDMKTGYEFQYSQPRVTAMASKTTEAGVVSR